MTNAMDNTGYFIPANKSLKDEFQFNHQEKIGNSLGLSIDIVYFINGLFGIDISTETDEYFITRTNKNPQPVN